MPEQTWDRGILPQNIIMTPHEAKERKRETRNEKALYAQTQR
jgi:hypothetical protein